MYYNLVISKLLFIIPQSIIPHYYILSTYSGKKYAGINVEKLDTFYSLCIIFDIRLSMTVIVSLGK